MVTKILQLITIRTKILILLQGFGKSKIKQTDKEVLENKDSALACNNVSVQD